MDNPALVDRWRIRRHHCRLGRGTPRFTTTRNLAGCFACASARLADNRFGGGR